MVAEAELIIIMLQLEALVAEVEERDLILIILVLPELPVKVMMVEMGVQSLGMTPVVVVVGLER